MTFYQNTSWMEHYDVSLCLWSKCDDDVMGGVYDSGVWWFISSSIYWLAKIHSEQKCITTLQLWTAIFFFLFFLLSRNSKFEAYVEMWMRNISFRPLYIRRWFFVSVAVQSFVHLLLWRPPEGFFSALPFLRSYVILVWSWQQRSALLVSHTVASFL